MAASRKPKANKKKVQLKDLKVRNAKAVKGGTNIERRRPIYKTP